MPKSPLLAVLDDAMESIKGGGNAVMPDRVESHIDPISEEAQAEKIASIVQPAGIKEPKVKGPLPRVADSKGVSGNSHDNRASTVVFQRAFRCTPTKEEANIGRFLPLLKPPVRAPAIPQCGENSRVHPGGSNLGKEGQVAGNKRARVTRKTKQTIRNTLPPFYLMPNSRDAIRSLLCLNGTKGSALEFTLNFINLLLGPVVILGGNAGIDGRGGDAFTLKEIDVFNKNTAIVVLVPLIPMDDSVGE